jgi:ABC-2 type transport system permease protein
MHPRAILAIARKDALDVLLNKSTLTLLVTPIFLAVLFVVLSGLIGAKTSDILVYDPGSSGVDQVVQSAFSNPKITRADSSDAVAAAFGVNGTHKSSPYALGLVVPADYEAGLRAGGHPQLSLFVNGDEVNAQNQALLVQALMAYNRSVATPQPPASIALATINPPSSVNFGTQLGQYYAMAALLSSFLVGTSLVPGMLIEEKERKTLRMLMVSPASWFDIVVGKLGVGLGYQVLMAAVVLGITRGFTGQVPLVLLFAALGCCFSVVLGALFGTLFKTTSAAGAAAGMVSFLYIIPVFAVGPFAQLFQSSPLLTLVKALPTYYLADGVFNALQNLTTPSGLALDAGVAVGSIVVVFAVAVWSLRRQAAVASTI